MIHHFKITKFIKGLVRQFKKGQRLGEKLGRAYARKK